MISISLVGCSWDTSNVTGSALRTTAHAAAPTQSHQIAIFAARTPARPYLELGLVQVQVDFESGGESGRAGSEGSGVQDLPQLPSQKLIEEMRRRAAQLGADAIIRLRTIRRRDCSSAGLFGLLGAHGKVNEHWYVEGVAIKYRGGPRKAPT